MFEYAVYLSLILGEPSSRIPTQIPSELQTMTPVPKKDTVATVKKSLSELYQLQSAKSSETIIIESDEDFEPAQLQVSLHLWSLAFFLHRYTEDAGYR